MEILNFEAISFQSLRALGSATPQRPEQSADQVYEGAGGEGGGGAEEQRGGQQQPRPRAGPVQAAGGEVEIKDYEKKFSPSFELLVCEENIHCNKIYVDAIPRCWRAQRSWPEQETVSVGLSR